MATFAPMRISLWPNSMRAVLFVILVGAAGSLSAQGKGRIVGRILDASTATPLAGAQVVLVEQPANVAIVALDGRYTLLNVPAGPVSVRVRMIGYQAKVISGLAMSDGGILLQDVVLSAQIVEVEAIAVTAGAEAGSVDAALEKQRTATNIVNSVTAEQISRSPDGKRSSGTTFRSGSGLGTRAPLSDVVV